MQIDKSIDVVAVVGVLVVAVVAVIALANAHTDHVYVCVSNVQRNVLSSARVL